MNNSEYPYAVDRLMACVYRRLPLAFGLGLSTPYDALRVSFAAPLGALSQAHRDAAIEAAALRSIESRRRMCVVFGPDDAVYVEPDGSRSVAPPPGGGLSI